MELKRNEFMQDVVFALVANKCDLELLRTVSKSEAEEYAESQGLEFFEVSAKMNEGVHEIFDEIAIKLVEK